MTERRRLLRAIAAALLVVPLLGACGVDTQGEPERIPSGGLPTDLRESGTEPTVGGP